MSQTTGFASCLLVFDEELTDGCFFTSDENSFLVSLSLADSLTRIRRDVGNYGENKSHVMLLIDPSGEIF